MKKIRILTDSGCDLDPQEAARGGVEILPFPMLADGRSCVQGTDYQTPKDFYRILERAAEIPKHAQIPPAAYYDAFLRLAGEGCEHLVAITIASSASATYGSALAARARFMEERPASPMNIHVVDSRCFSVAYGYPALAAARGAREGRDIGGILSGLEDWFSSVEIYVSAYSLEYAHRSGRVGGASFVVGEALGVRPIISIIQGRIKTYRKVRGNAAVAKALADIALARMRPGSPYGMLYGSYEGARDDLRARLAAATGYEPFGMYQAGPVIAVNIGPKMLGVGFLSGLGSV